MTDPEPAPERVWDEGLQPERTTLAWRRAALAFLGLGLAAPKLLWPALGGWSLLPAVAVLGGAAVLFLAAHDRYVLTHRTLVRGRQPRLPDGRLPLLATGLALTVAAMGVLFIATDLTGIDP